MHKVFVYGSLKKGFGNSVYLNNSKFIKEDRARGFKMVSLGSFPGAIRSENQNDMIYGELYEVDDKTLRNLDALEGYSQSYSDNFYTREVINLISGEECFIYTLPESYLKKEIISTGMWEHSGNLKYRTQ